MHEAILKDYFDGLCSIRELQTDLEGTVIKEGIKSSYHIIDMDCEFEVKPHHLVKLCDAVLANEFEAANLQTIGFCLIASDYFKWDADTEPGYLVSETVFDWSSPEINFPLTLENVHKFRERLLTGRDLLKDIKSG